VDGRTGRRPELIPAILDILLSPPFALYLAMTAAVCLTPGPNVMLVVSLGLDRSLRPG